MQWDDSYRYFPKHDENGRVQSSHHYFDTTDEAETLAAASRRLYGTPPTPSLFASMVPSIGSVIRCTGWVVLVVFIDFVFGVLLDGLSGRGGGDRRWGPLVRAIFKAIAPEGKTPRAQTGTPQTPRPKETVSSRYASPTRPARPHIDIPQREGSMVRSTTADKPVNTPSSQQPAPSVTRGGNNTTSDEDAAPGLQWLLAATITLMRGLGWVLLWLLSIGISMIPRSSRERGRGWSAVDQVQRRVDAALRLLTPPTQEELLRRELGRMLQQSLKDNEGGYNNARDPHHRPEMMSRVVALSHNMLEMQRMDACKDGKLLSPSSSQRVGVPAHMQFGGRSNQHHATATSHSDSSLKEVYELWDRLLGKSQAMAAPYTSGTSCLPTAKDSTANNEALLRELLLQMGHRPQHHGASSSSSNAPLWGRGGGGKHHAVHYGKDSGSPPRLSRMLSDARGEHNKLSAMFALDGNAHTQSNNTNHPSGRGVVLGEVEAQLLSMVAGGRPQMPHRGTILGPLNPTPAMQQPNVNPFDCPPQQQQPMQPQQPQQQQQQGQWGAVPQQQQQPQQQGLWGQQQQAPQQQMQPGGFPQQQQQPAAFGQQQQNNNQFQGNMQQQNGMNGAAGGGMGGVFAGGGNNNFNNQQQNAFNTNTNNNNGFNNNAGASNVFAQGGNTNNGFPANNNNTNSNNNFNNNFNSNNQNNGASNNGLWGNNNNGSQQQSGGFGSNNQNNNGFDQSAATSKVLFDDEPVMGRGTVNENNNNCPFSALSPETASSCNRFQRPPTTSPPVSSGFGGSTFAAGPRRAPAPCRSMDEVPVGEVKKARGGIAISVDMGPTVGPNSRPPLRSSRLATPAKPSGNLPSHIQANMERRQQELAERKLERQSGTTRNSAFAHDRVSTPADACPDWNSQRPRVPGRPAGSAVNFDDMPVGVRR